MTRLMRTYNRDVSRWLLLPANQLCAVDLARDRRKPRAATQCHHVRGRLGPLLLDRRFWKPVSMEGHQWIDRNKDEARRLGLLAAVGEWHVIPDDAETRRIRNIILEITK